MTCLDKENILTRGEANKELFFGMILSAMIATFLSAIIAVGYIWDQGQKYEYLIVNMADIHEDSILRMQQNINYLRYDLEQKTHELNLCESGH